MPCVSRIRMMSSISSVRTHVPASVKLGSYQRISLPKLKQVGGIQLAISRLKCFAHPRGQSCFHIELGIGSLYGKNQPNVGIYTIHGSYGLLYVVDVY